MIVFVKNLLVGIIIVIGVGYLLNFIGDSQYIENEPVVEVQIPEENSEEAKELTEIVKEPVPIDPEPVQESAEMVLEKINILENLIDEMVQKEEEPLQEEPIISFSEINTRAREALVNIVCTTETGGPLSPISGSGIIVDPRGIILTNAHVAQYYLLKDYLSEGYIDCVIRTGSPAKISYRAEPIYISEAWIFENASLIDDPNPLGTGEHDFAFLAITESADVNTALPASFPFVPITSGATLSKQDSVFIGGYPAGFLSGAIIQKDLNITSTIGQISELFTFETGTVDLITIEGSIVSQQGASGGAVIDNKGDVIGIVVTSTSADSTSDRVLGAITAGHIHISLLQQRGDGIGGILNTNVARQINLFRDFTSTSLKEALVEELN